MCTTGFMYCTHVVKNSPQTMVLQSLRARTVKSLRKRNEEQGK